MMTATEIWRLWSTGMWCCVTSKSEPQMLRKRSIGHARAHTHTHIYIYVCVCVYTCI